MPTQSSRRVLRFSSPDLDEEEYAAALAQDEDEEKQNGARSVSQHRGGSTSQPLFAPNEDDPNEEELAALMEMEAQMAGA